MGQNTPQAMIMDVLGTFMPHPGVILIPRNPQAVAGFWPPLFDYRGQAALANC